MQLSSRLVSEGTKKADKKMGKIRRWRGGEGTDHRLGSIPILPDLLIFLFHPLHLGRPALRCVELGAKPLFMESNEEVR